jgi:hypothetical protein
MKYADEIQKVNGLVSQARHMLEEVTCEMMDDGFADQEKLSELEERIGELDHVEYQLESIAPTN